jgi:hypothetical protein
VISGHDEDHDLLSFNEKQDELIREFEIEMDALFSHAIDAMEGPLEALRERLHALNGSKGMKTPRRSQRSREGACPLCQG